MAANYTTPAAATTPQAPHEPLLSLAWKRVLLAGAAYIALITWFALMQMLFGWDPELLPFIALTGAALLMTFVFATVSRDADKDEDQDKD